MDTLKQRLNRKWIIALFAAVVLIAGAAITLFIVRPWVDKAPVRLLTGEAEAVLTTKVGIIDGLQDLSRQLDELYYPVGVVRRGTELIIADSMCDRIQIVDEVSSRRIGRPGQYGLSYFDSGALVDGYRENAMFMKPAGVAIAPNGDIVVADTGNNVIRRIDDEFVITIAGNGQGGFRDGCETDARFNAPRAVAVDAHGNIYVADTMNNCIRRIDTEGNVTLFAGNPAERAWRDGALLEARFHEPSGIAVSPSGEIFVADSGNHSIRRIADGVVTTIAGAPGELDRSSGYSSGGYIDGDNESVRFNFPRDIAVTPDGAIVVADSMNHAIRIIEDGTTRTLVGNGVAGQMYASAENMMLTRPEGVYTDGETLYIADTINNRVVRVPMQDRVMEGRPSRDEMLRRTGITTDSRYSYHGDIRVFVDDQRLDMGRVQPWNTPEGIYIPVRPLFEALGATVYLDERTNVLSVTIQEQDTHLYFNREYFILRGVTVTTIDEVVRLFPYTLEWFPEFSMIALHIPSDIR